MADYVAFQMKDGEHWTELKPQIKRHDNGNSHSHSHSPMLDSYLRMLAEFRRIMDSRERGFSRLEYLLTPDELERISEASIHPSRRNTKIWPTGRSAMQ